MDTLKRIYKRSLKTSFISKNLFLLLVISFSMISSHSLFHSGLLPTHDGEYHVIRFYEFDKTLRAGNLYPRWATDLSNGFGLPLFNYVYPLPNYVASLFHFVGFSFIDSFKLNLLFASVLGSLFMFLWAQQFWGKLGGLVSSVFYAFSPYHFLDVYIRGSVGEVWALAFFPAYLWSITEFDKTRKVRFLILSAIFLALIIFSHNILAIMFFFLAVSYSFFLFINSQKKSILPFIAIFITAIGITSIFWMPAIFEKQYVRGLEIYSYSDNFPEAYQLIVPSWGSGFSSDLQNQLSFQIGIANLLAVVASILFFFKKGINKKILVFFLVWFLIVFFLMLRISLPLWKNLPFFNYFQFPWRFLSLEILFASFLAGGLVKLFKSRITAIFLITASIVLGIGYSNIAYYLERTDSYYTSRSNFIDGTNSSGNAFNTIWMGGLQKRKEKLIFLKGNGNITAQTVTPTVYSFKLESKTQSQLVANIAYFPNWAVYVNGRKQKTKITGDGLFSFQVPQGKNDILIKLEDTNIRKLATAVSILSIIALFIYSRFVKIKVITFVSQRS